MNLNELILIQKEFDKRHNFKIVKRNQKEKYSQITKDLVGLFGEIGEFSNIVKKINLSLDANLKNSFIHEQEDNLREELIDFFIYFLRLADLCDLNIEEEYLKKKNFNEKKYERFK